MERAESSYWLTFSTAVRTLLVGLKLTFRHILKARRSQQPVIVSSPDYFRQPDGIVTVQYPYTMQPIPDTGRYRLHNEIDDCIVCDKCAKVCPVNCITIEPIKAVEEIGRTSDGTPKRIYAAKFDIDMGKCCFCGLCTTVCPTECLTMTKVYDFSVFDIREHNFVFGEMTEAEIAAKKKVLEDHQKSKQSPVVQPVVQAAAPTEEKKESSDIPKPSKPVFRPKIKPAGPPTGTS